MYQSIPAVPMPLPGPTIGHKTIWKYNSLISYHCCTVQDMEENLLHQEKLPPAREFEISIIKLRKIT